MCHCVQWQLKSVVGQSNVVISVAKQLLRVFDKDFLGSGPNSFFSLVTVFSSAAAEYFVTQT
jgi:hypothetical protein